MCPPMTWSATDALMCVAGSELAERARATLAAIHERGVCHCNICAEKVVVVDARAEELSAFYEKTDVHADNIPVINDQQVRLDNNVQGCVSFTMTFSQPEMPLREGFSREY